MNVLIRSIGSVSPLGSGRAEIWQSYQFGKSCIQNKTLGAQLTPVAGLHDSSEKEIEDLLKLHPNYTELDRVTLLALCASRQAFDSYDLNSKSIGVCIGSSRGTTELLEKYHTSFLATGEKRVPVLTSPTTTLGNISSWIAQDLKLQGPSTSMSATCSSSLYAIANGMAWLKAGFCGQVLVGGAEAALTPFSVAQMRALRIYSSEGESPFPCRPHNLENRNTMVLGEGACVVALELASNSDKEALGVIDSIGFGMESIETNTSLSQEGQAISVAMNQALKNRSSEYPIDLIILHSPGTVLGDLSELNAIKKVFGSELPLLISNKWLIGHTMGAAGVFGLEYALLILQKQEIIDFPYAVPFKNSKRPIRSVMINSAGFGGHAVSLIVSREAHA